MCLWLAYASGTFAQPSASADQDASRASDAAAARAPEVVRLAEVEAPAGSVQTPTLDVTVVIDADGHPQLVDADVPLALQLAITSALEHSEFRAAELNGKPTAARVRLSLHLAPPTAAAQPQPSAAKTQAAVPASALSPSAAARGQTEPDTYSASGRVAASTATGERMNQREMRDLPGAIGDPFRVLDALPGVVPALSGLPYVYVRGAPPAGTVYFYDGIQVPALFHLALGPAVVHPALVGTVDFYPGVAPARYGRYTGGVLSGGPQTLPTPTEAHGELELRVIDSTAMIETPVAGGSFIAAGRYGYPGPIVHLFSPTTQLDYWDYQTRLSLPIDAHDRIELTWFGSYDNGGGPEISRANGSSSSDDTDQLTLEFHRGEARFIRQVGNFEFGSALQVGYDRSAIPNSLSVHSARFGPRTWAVFRGESGWRLRVGADLIGTVGRIDSAPNQDDALVQIRVPVYADVAARSVAGAYGEFSLPLSERWTLDLGLRSDTWFTGSRVEAAVDPRLTMTLRTSEALAFHVSGGLAHQPSVYLVPLPGIADVGLEHGLETAIQSEAGLKLTLPAALSLETQVYLQHLTNVIYPDLVLEQTSDCGTLPSRIADMTPRCQGFPRASSVAYGWEVFLRRASTERLSGWLTYTLGWARAHAAEGYSFTPSFDVRHLLNLVLQYRLGKGFSFGTRLFYRSGKMANFTFVRDGAIRYEQRLPGFFRGDVQLSYSWEIRPVKLRLSLEWFNVTLSREATSIDCRDGVGVGANPLLTATPCMVTRAPVLFVPNLGLRGEL